MQFVAEGAVGGGGGGAKCARRAGVPAGAARQNPQGVARVTESRHSRVSAAKTTDERMKPLRASSR
eukprot:1654263-Rhodomonas_salina.3